MVCLTPAGSDANPIMTSGNEKGNSSIEDTPADGDCRPEDVGLSGVDIISLGRIHAELQPGEAVLSSSDSKVRLGLVCSNLHMCADKCGCISDFSRSWISAL